MDMYSRVWVFIVEYGLVIVRYHRRGTHVTGNMCSRVAETHFTRDVCFPGRGTHIARNMCS